MKPKQHEADKSADQYLSIEHALSHRTRAFQLTLIVACAVLAASLGLCLCFGEHEAFSPEENRTLTTAPTLSTNTLLDGSWSRALSDFCADQFPFRSTFVAAKAASELALGKQQNNDVLLGKNGYLIARLEYTDEQREHLESNLRAVRLFSERMAAHDIPFTFAVVPRSIDVNAAQLPPLYDTSRAYAVWPWLNESCEREALPMIDLREPLRAAADRGESVWYKTDHHWSALGAYYAYAALGEALSYEPYPITDFEMQVVCENFYGTTYASSGMHWTDGEPLALMRFEGDERYVTDIIRADGTHTLQGLYDFAALDTHDEYNVFLGGTNAHIRVSDPSRPDLPTLVLLKDSFSQSLAPYLVRHFHLVLIDPRTFMASPDSSLFATVCDYKPDHVLLLCGIATLCEPSSQRNLIIGLDR